MSNAEQIEDLIAELEPCSPHDVMPHTTLTKEQVYSAFGALVSTGRIIKVDPGKRGGRLEDRRSSTYKINERRPVRGGAFWQRKVSSVFELGRMS